ncbi:MAG TPA: prepilin-type N-terminal cleavage/methylation domain-containing protein [Chthoniobacteraceae bacterium]|nr:prepilin-type N-terminal cleavage/methylation domain-containing protein [Chthoniobacteraceae bacterium]
MNPFSWKAPSGTRGFTLIELLVVVAIIALLAGLLFPVLSAVREHARKVQATSDVKMIVGTVSSYYTEYQKYPVDPVAKPGDAVYSSDNNALFDVLRNVTGTAVGNTLNPRGVVFLTVNAAPNPNMPVAGLSTTGVWYDPWGSPYNIAVDGNSDGLLNSPQPLPGFYSDVGPLQAGAIAWSYGRNGQPGGGPAASTRFSSEAGTPGVFAGSGDVGSW